MNIQMWKSRNRCGGNWEVLRTAECMDRMVMRNVNGRLCAGGGLAVDVPHEVWRSGEVDMCCGWSEWGLKRIMRCEEVAKWTKVDGQVVDRLLSIVSVWIFYEP